MQPLPKLVVVGFCCFNQSLPFETDWKCQGGPADQHVVHTGGLARSRGTESQAEPLHTSYCAPAGADLVEGYLREPGNNS